MATAFPVTVKLRPGVQSIEVKYKPSASFTTWYNYVPGVGQRIQAGYVVKFIFTLYLNFNFSSASAFYADEYDDTVDLTLSTVTGETARTFTMPNAEVFVEVEAEANSSSSVIITPTSFPTYTSASQVPDYYLISFMDRATFIQLFNNALVSVGEYGVNSNMAAIIENYFAEQQNMAWLLITHETQGPDAPGTFLIIGRLTSQPTLPALINSTTMTSNCTTHYYKASDFVIGADTTFEHLRDRSNQLDYIPGFRASINQSAGITVRMVTPIREINYTTPAPSSGSRSIRYVMSPSESGELVTGSPSEISADDTAFQFSWRLKAGYEYSRIRAFAIGTPPTETQITAAVYSYDGSTRTYAFSVSDITSWALGVTVYIETIMLNDPSTGGGTNDPNYPNGPDTGGGDSSQIPPGGNPVGGNGTYDDTSDPVPLPSIPSISAANSGLITIFRPSLSEIRSLGNYLWSNIDEFWENLQKLFSNPMDYIVGLNIFPVTPPVGTSRNIYIGNFLTDISMSPVLNQFVEFDCGIIEIEKYFDSALDYAPNTKARIMLPFIGDCELSINEIMGKRLRLWYRIDLLSGGCLAVLLIDGDVYYQWTGNCAIPVPVTGSDWSRLYGSIARVGIAVGTGAVVAGGMGALGFGLSALGGFEVDKEGNQWYSPNFNSGTSRGATSLADNIATGIGNALSHGADVLTGPRSRAIAASAVGATVGYNMMNAIPRVQHSGNLGGSVSILGSRTPFVVLEYPNVNLPLEYKHFYGYPSNKYTTLNTLSGYTECTDVLFESTTATDDEIAMIIKALKGGVYL